MKCWKLLTQQHNIISQKNELSANCGEDLKSLKQGFEFQGNPGPTRAGSGSPARVHQLQIFTVNLWADFQLQRHLGLVWKG